MSGTGGTSAPWPRGSLARMGRALFAVGTLLAVLFLSLGLLIYSSRDDEFLAVDNLLSEDLTREFGTAEDRREQVVIADSTDFAWDRMVLVDRGTDDDAISERLGFEWTGEVGFEVGELIIFLQGGKLVRYADYRGEGQFVGVRRPTDDFTPEDAVFRVEDLAIQPVTPRSGGT